MLRKWSPCLLVVALAVLPAAAEMSLDEIIAKNIESKGGRDKMDSVKSIRAAGRMTMMSPQGEMEAPLSIESKRPGKVRVEFVLQGMTGVQAYDGTKGWQIMPFMGKTDAEEMSADDLEQIKEQADFDGPLIDYEEKGHQVELIGKEEIEGTEAYKIKLTKENGDVTYYYLDAEYFLEIKTKGIQKVQGMEMDVESTIGDYKEINGLLLPHTIEQSFGTSGMTQTLVIDSYELNADVADDRFAMPEPAPSEDAGEGE